MSYLPSHDFVESPAAIQESDMKRPPMLGLRSTQQPGPPTTLTASPASSTFEQGTITPPGVRFHGSTSEPDLNRVQQLRRPQARRESTADMPQVIPQRRDSDPRTLVLCFDGTGDQFDQDNSNIVQFFQLLKKDDRNKQMVYYQAGIGTSSKHFVTPIGTALSKTVDMAIAHGLRDHVTDGYEFLMQNYIEGDKIAMFGFSRGAYTARALAGMLHKVGLLPPCNYQQVPFAYHMYKRDDKEGWEMSNGFKQAFSIDVEINFMGLFDTVNSVGLVPRELPFAKSNYVVRTFRHAVALDERRAKFKANLWGRISDEDAALAAPKREDYQSRKKREKLRRQAEEQQKATLYGYSAGMVGSVGGMVGSVTGAVGSVGGYVASSVGSMVGYGNGTTSPGLDEKRSRIPEGSGIVPTSSRSQTTSDEKGLRKRNTVERKSSSGADDQEVAHAIGGKHIERSETDVEEVWFSGAHTDVGGGSVKNGERYSLARISMRWMVRQCFKCNTGIMFHTNLLEDIGLSPETLWPKVLPRPPPIMSLDDIPAAMSMPPLISHSSEPHLPPYSAMPTSTNDPTFNAQHPGFSDATALDNSRAAEAKRAYGEATDRDRTQLSHKVNPYEPYLPFGRFGHELDEFGEDAREPREPFISEEVEDLKDALAPIYDQLKLNWWWWILELIPAKQVWRKSDKTWRRFLSVNLGGPRVIKNQKREGVNVHRTVQIRINAKKDIKGKKLSYYPSAWLKMKWVRWIGGSE